MQLTSAMLNSFMYAAALSATLLAFMLKWNVGQFLLDRPNSRSLHGNVVPRMGGLAILTTLLVLANIKSLYYSALIMPPLLMLALTSVCDDKASLSVTLRLTVQFIAATLFVLLLTDYAALFGENPSETFLGLSGLVGCILLVLVTLWMTNLYNFMDGANGLAGGMTLIGFLAYAFAASPHGAHDIAFVGTIVSGAALGFLFFNFHPARVFMGDAGSIPLGFLAAALGILGNLKNVWPWWYGPLVFSPFIVDATVTLLKRACQRKKIWQAHREHYYQRLVLMGWSHRRLALTEYVLMLACAASALYASSVPAEQSFLQSTISVHTAILLLWGVIYLALIILLEIVFRRRQRQTRVP